MNATFHKNIELWSHIDPKHALMLPYTDPSDVQFAKTRLNETSIKKKISDKWVPLHAQSGAVSEAQNWFNALDLQKVVVLYVYGIGLGYYYDAAKAWLKKDKKRRLVFLEDDLAVMYRFLETERATTLLQDPQVQLLFFQDLKDNEATFEVLYWNFAMTRMQVSALQAYAKSKKELYDQFQHKIAYDFAVKNALVDEYLRFGGPFFLNFYQNILSLPGSYLGNKTFGTFRKVPAIICGAGPSLAKNLPLLAELKDKALIFAGGSALNALNAAGIQPHLGAGIDPNPAQYERLSSNQAYEVPFYYRNRMYHDAFEMIHGPRLYVTGTGGYDVATYFEEKLNIAHEFLDEGHNVINFCLQIAQQLKCDPIIFIGLDLAFTGMKSYAPGVEAHVEFDPNSFVEVDEFDEKPLLLKDIYGKPLYTLWKWVAESEWISDFAKEHSEVKIINATEGGLGFKDVPNVPLAEVTKDYLTRSYAISDRLHGEIQNSAMPQVTLRKMEHLMRTLRDSLKRCEGYFDILLEDVHSALQQKNPSLVQSGRAALCETELAEEPGYQYVLDIFNAVQSRLFNREMQEIKSKSEKIRARRKLEMNGKRLNFLKDVAKINVGIIEMALEKRKKEKRPKSKKNPSAEPDATLPDCDFKDFDSLLLPKDAAAGDKIGKDHFVAILREYGQSSTEARIEKRGQLDGQCLTYYPGGEIKSEVFYKQGRLHGPSTFYSQQGKVLARSSFVQGKQEGECKWYYPSGALYSLQRFKKGLWHGKQEYYYEDGTPKTILQYKNGKLELSDCR